MERWVLQHPAANTQGKDTSRLFVQIFTSHECAVCILPWSHLKPFPDNCYVQFFPGGSLPIPTDSMEKWPFPHLLSWKRGRGLHAQLTLALSAPYAAIWFCWSIWSLSRVWFMWPEQQHSHCGSRARWLTLPLLKGKAGSHQAWVLRCPLLDTSGEGKAFSLLLALGLGLGHAM